MESTGLAGGQADPAAGSAIRIVVADDAMDLRILLQARLARYGDIVVVESVPDGMEAIAAVDRTGPDAVLLDLSMPRMDGLETAAALRQTHRDLSIIVLSGHPEETMGARALAAGADAYVEKSLDLTELVDVLRSTVQVRRAAQP